MRKLICYCDGACEPVNPYGHMGIGAVIFENGKSVFEYSKHIPASKQNSNNVAEYLAVHAVLDWLIQQELTNEEILVRGDSKLSMMQCAGEWNINKGIYVSLAHEARRKITPFSNIRFEWVPREMNENADNLSKTPMMQAGVEFRLQKQW